MKLTYKYLFISGIFSHIALLFLFIWQPILASKITSKFVNKYYEYQRNTEYEKLTLGTQLTVHQELSATLTPWLPVPKTSTYKAQFLVNSVPYSDLKSAVRNLKDGDTLFITEGVYRTPITIFKNNVTIKGIGHVIFEKSAARGKGFILSQGDNLTVENIECRFVSVRDGNGACIRLEGVNLTLNHVYFHDAQEGILETSKHPGNIYIYDSRFEQLGFNGQAHGIYTNKANLYIYNSLVLASKGEGHALKVRGENLLVESSIIASLSSRDSRLIDMPNGGRLTVANSILAQGPKSANGQVIGFGLEGITNKVNKIDLIGNIIYLERLGENYLLVKPEGQSSNIAVKQNQNVIIGNDLSNTNEQGNTYFKNRDEVNLPAFPFFPTFFCKETKPCVILKSAIN